MRVVVLDLRPSRLIKLSQRANLERLSRRDCRGLLLSLQFARPLPLFTIFWREFAQRGVTQIGEFLTASEFEKLGRRVTIRSAVNLFHSMEGDSQVGGAPCEGTDPIAEELLMQKAWCTFSTFCVSNSFPPTAASASTDRAIACPLTWTVRA